MLDRAARSSPSAPPTAAAAVTASGVPAGRRRRRGRTRAPSAALVLVAATVLVACGGDDDQELPEVTDGQRIVVTDRADGEVRCEEYQSARPEGVRVLLFDVPGEDDVRCVIR